MTNKLSFRDALLYNISSSPLNIDDPKHISETNHEKMLHHVLVDASQQIVRINSISLADDKCSTNNKLKCNKQNKMCLGGGKSFQKCGERLEKAIYKCMPDHIKKFTKCNYKPIAINGDIIVEYDLLYLNKLTNTVITFEIKGLNKYTCYPERKQKILEQLLNQQKNSKLLFNSYKIYNVFCIITGSASSIDEEYVKLLISKDFIVAVGQSPYDAIKCAIKKLHLI